MTFLEQELINLDKQIGFGIVSNSLKYEIAGPDDRVHWDAGSLTANIFLQLLEGPKLSISLSPAGFKVVKIENGAIGSEHLDTSFETIETLLQQLSPKFRDRMANELIRKLGQVETL